MNHAQPPIESSENVFENFELHYHTSAKGVKDLLQDILEDVASCNRLHDWDKQLRVSPVRRMMKTARDWMETYPGSTSALMFQSGVERVVTKNDTCYKLPTVDHSKDIASHLFFSKVNSETTSLVARLTIL